MYNYGKLKGGIYVAIKFLLDVFWKKHLIWMIESTKALVST